MKRKISKISIISIRMRCKGRTACNPPPTWNASRVFITLRLTAAPSRRQKLLRLTTCRLVESRDSVRSTRGQSIGISIGMLLQTLIMSITVQKTSKYYTTEFDLEEGFLNGACISISNLPENIAWQTHRPEARGVGRWHHLPPSNAPPSIIKFCRHSVCPPHPPHSDERHTQS